MNSKWLRRATGLRLPLVLLACLATGRAEEPSPAGPPTGPPLVVVLDSGVAADHAVFHGRWLAASEVATRLPAGMTAAGAGEWPGWDFLEQDAQPQDRTGHGTHVAGMVADALARGGKACATVRLVMLRTGDGRQKLEDVTAAVAAVSAMREAGWDIPVVLCAFEYRRNAADEAAFVKFEQAFRKLLESGVTCVCAAGNQGLDNDALAPETGEYPASFQAPAMIAVAACGNDGQLLATSNYGVAGVMLGAPGLAVRAAAIEGGSEERSGSSQAAAWVAGCLAHHAAETGERQPAAMRAWLLTQVKLHPSLVGRVASAGALVPAK